MRRIKNVVSISITPFLTSKTVPIMTWYGLMIFKLKTYFGINDSSEEPREAKTRIPTSFGIKIEIKNEIGVV